MKLLNSITAVAIVAVISTCQAFAQKKTVEVRYFSAVQGSGSKIDSISVPLQKAEKLTTHISGKMAGDFKVLGSIPGTGSTATDAIVKFRYEPKAGFTGISTAVLEIRNGSKLVMEVNLKGIALPGLEGENEASLSEILSIMEIATEIGWNTLANHIRSEPQGEEITGGLFVRALDGPVLMTPLARYSPPCALPFGYYQPSEEGPVLKQVGVLSDSKNFHEHQTLFPAVAEGGTAFNPADGEFGLYVVSDTHNSFSEDAWNQIKFPANVAHATRIFPVRMNDGTRKENSYLVCFEEASNGDYQDYVFLIENVKPVDPRKNFEILLNQDDLQGWSVFLQSTGVNSDPENNFTVKEGILHDIGREAGYILTDRSYTNFHLRLQFKWGERRWPPRETARRDSGICYHVPDDAEYEIWPQSIECQIQEGDVGDFWLLGYSTIEVEGKQNEPLPYSRLVKARDNERPSGEWNTVEVLTFNGICVHIVNGVVVNYGTNSSLRKGKILLQSEFAEIFYRNVEIKVL